MSVRASRLIFVCLPLLLFASNAFSEGTYQRTRDGKTIVWNNYPQPGDVASWFGERDRDGYARGFGTLTWYKPQQQVATDSEIASTRYVEYARYFGNMRRGKFDGPVNAHSQRKTAYAIFVDGHRTTAWVPGTAPSRNITELPIGRAAEKIRSMGETKPSEPPGSERSVQQAPAEGPEKPANSSRNELLRRAERTQKPVAGLSDGASPSESRTELAAVRGSAGPSPAPVASPPSKERPAKRAPTRTGKVETDNQVRKLTRPPSSLQSKQLADASHAPFTDKEAGSRAASPRLGKQEVLELADAEARAHGYNPAEYQRPEPEFDPVDQTWSLLYEEKPGDGMVDIGRHFSVAVDDKSKNISVVP